MSRRSHKRKHDSDEEWEPDLDDFTSDFPELVHCDKKTKTEFTRTQEEVQRTEPNIVDILNTPLLLEDKVELFQLFEVYANVPDSVSLERLEIRKQIKSKLEQAKTKYRQYNKYTEREHAQFAEEIKKLEQYDENHELKYDILRLETSQENKQTIYNEYKRMRNMPFTDDELPKLRNWLKWSLALPHDRLRTIPYKKRELTRFLQRVSKAMDDELYGMYKVKEQILLFLNTRIVNPRMKKCSLGLIGPPGVGKCLAPDTPVLLFDGSIKEAQNILVGDKLMGDDSSPRSVSSICSGREEMFEVIPSKGKSYTVNRSHILTLMGPRPLVKYRKSRNVYIAIYLCPEEIKLKSVQFRSREEADKFISTLPADPVVDIPIDQYLQLPKSTQKKLYTYHTGVEFSSQKVPIDPYLLGCWLGDGSSRYTIDQEIVHTGAQHNPFMDDLRKLNLIMNKHIPLIYKNNSREVRLKLLAGLIDTDGYVNKNRPGMVEIIQKSRQLTDDITYIAYSLGFMVTCNPVKKYCIYKGEKQVGIYYKTIIFGDYVHTIPTVLEPKKILPQRINKRSTCQEFKLVSKGVGPYNGFTIDGNRRFLLGDFTVTHNTKICQVIADVLDYPMEQIKMGGIRSPEFLKGHQYTYIGAEPGEIVKCLCRMKCKDSDKPVKNGILFFDEYEKISDDKLVSSALLHITDATQNHKFQDNFLSGITIDLSYLWFFYSMNEKPADDALADRVFYIEIDGYSQLDKFFIVKDYLLRKAHKNMGWDPGSVTFTDETITKLVEKVSPPENKGIRTLDDAIQMIARKINFLYHHQNRQGKTTGFKTTFSIGERLTFPFNLGVEKLDTFLS